MCAPGAPYGAPGAHILAGGACMVDSILHFLYTHLWVYTIHPLLQYLGTTGKGYFTTVL